MTSPSHLPQGRHYSLFAGPDLAVDFGHDGQAAIDYMADHADEILGEDCAIIVADAKGMCEIALIDARGLREQAKPPLPPPTREELFGDG